MTLTRCTGKRNATMKDYLKLSIHLVTANPHDAPKDIAVLEGMAIPAECAESFLADVQKLAAEKYGLTAFDEALVSGLGDNSTDTAKQEQREDMLRHEKNEAVEKSSHWKKAIFGAAVCLALVAAFAINNATPSDEKMQLDNVSSVLYAASSSEVKEAFPSAKANEEGDLEIEGSCGETAGTYTVYLKEDKPHLISFTPADLGQNDSVKDELEARFDGHDGYNARLQYFEYTDSSSSILIKFYPSSGVRFYQN